MTRSSVLSKHLFERIFMHKDEQMAGPLSVMEQRTRMRWLPGLDSSLFSSCLTRHVDIQTKETDRPTFLFCLLVAFSYLSDQVLLV